MGGKLGLLFLLAWVVVASGSVVSLPIKAVNLGGWLVVEGWMTNLFQGVDMGYALMVIYSQRANLVYLLKLIIYFAIDRSMETHDGTCVTLWSATQGMFLSAVGGSGSDVVANQGEAKDWETLRYNLGVIGDLHAAPWSQNGQSHSSSRDGTVGWGDQKIDETVRVIEGLAARYAAKKSLLGIGLLNEPSEQVHIDTLKKYYKAGYNAVRNQVKRDDVYVIMEGRLAGGGDSKMADFAGQFRN
ncbi:putative glucan 1,3-beta-glucosidase A [Hordeum vulgare]|nr:putative glucan 1,3-beta-glucosidase A [Hordeum vulgare]